MVVALALVISAQAWPAWVAPYSGVRRSDVDSTTLRGKVLCGYQGWFRAPGDGTGQGWFHWSRNRSKIDASTLTFEMWPEVGEYPAEARFAAGDFRMKDGRKAELFSSAHPGVVEKHFEWMRKYGIDGVFVQRFLGGLDGGKVSAEEARVLGYARDAANRNGRLFAVEYDMSGTEPAVAIGRMKKDWRFLVDTMKLTDDPRYLRHKGKPVLAVFGFFTDRFSGREANAIIDAFDTKDKYAVTLIGAGQWWWRKETDPEWSRAFRRFAAYSPWDVGNTGMVDGKRVAATARWGEDLAEAKRSGMMLLPVLYPGFSWDNLMRKPPGTTNIPRRRGEFFREQFRAAASVGVEQAFVAMFDEVDEGTAIFKVTNSPAVGAHFLGFEGLASDAYLRMTGEGTNLIRAGLRR